MSQWVQHISGQGGKWEVIDSYSCSSQWMVKALMVGHHHFLPKSDYRLCDPPEVWRDVTADCRIDSDPYSACVFHEKVHVARYMNSLYRLRKVQLWRKTNTDTKFTGVAQEAFIVEKRDP